MMRPLELFIEIDKTQQGNTISNKTQLISYTFSYPLEDNLLVYP